MLEHFGAGTWKLASIGCDTLSRRTLVSRCFITCPAIHLEETHADLGIPRCPELLEYL
jgi:hypothetical protein